MEGHTKPCACGATITRAPGATSGPLRKRCTPCHAQALRSQAAGTARRALLRRRIPPCVSCGGSVDYGGTGRRFRHCTACLAAARADHACGAPMAAVAARYAFVSADAAYSATRRYRRRVG